MESVEVRRKLVDALRLDLVGPDKDSELEEEVLPQAPSRWYATGFLVPTDAGVSQRIDETSTEGAEELDDAGATDDAETPEPPSAKIAYFPSSIGLSVLVPQETRELKIAARWGDYGPAPRASRSTRGESNEAEGPSGFWQRTQRESLLAVELPRETEQPVEYEVPDSGGLIVVVSVRPVGSSDLCPGVFEEGTRSVSVFLVNGRRPASDKRRDKAFVFQAELDVESDTPLVPRPNLRGLESEDWDERVADLQYRGAFEHGVGHGISTEAVRGGDGHCRRIRTCWIPASDVERVAPAKIEGVELSMEALSKLGSREEARGALNALVEQYREWIEPQRQESPAGPSNRAEIAEELLRRARVVADRIDAGIQSLSEPDVLESFRLANRVMAVSMRQRLAVMKGKSAESIEPPAWRPFQLAFVLMNIPGVVDPTSPDGGIVDLLFFPTGGGKTEAYFGLAAFTLILRRLRNEGVSSAGVCVLMRYTLRLLTLDQLGRASTLICALELERQRDPEKLGKWPFEIGLWVGQAATPNRMGSKGDNDPYSARRKTIAFKNDDSRPSPIPLEECPWCGTKFTANSFYLDPNPDKPVHLRIVCSNRRCEFTRDRPLPILAVDEPIYRRLPCFLIATVDKFAAMPWTGRVGALFGLVDRADRNGFYGPCDPNLGQRLPGGRLLPPQLIIQDELHLISGPLGTMVGLYETALDELSTHTGNGKQVRPKIIASTATVRRAEKQIRGLFARRVVEVFPPPGPNLRDSFFARTLSTEESHARLYVGIAAQGRSLKVVLLRTYLALLAAAGKAYGSAGGHRNRENPADPYMTVLGYFNSLRELGGSRRIIEDEVATRLTSYGRRKRVDEDAGPFADREIEYDIVELTSRVSTGKVAEAKRRLALPFYEKDRVDVAIATNMISVGLDITRLGLMVVLGQPKTTAEYIQATSRVGRDEQRPGLVVTLLNIHRPRDRSHYERFSAYHESFYRSVEATSVTPFSPRALDRGLAGTVVALARQGHSPMTQPLGAMEIMSERPNLEFVVDAISRRASEHTQMSEEESQTLRQNVRHRALDLLDEWARIAEDFDRDGVKLQYQIEAGGAQRLLYEYLNPELSRQPLRFRKFRANRSLRDVEPNVNLWLKRLDDGAAVEDET